MREAGGPASPVGATERSRGGWGLCSRALTCNAPAGRPQLPAWAFCQGSRESRQELSPSPQLLAWSAKAGSSPGAAPRGSKRSRKLPARAAHTEYDKQGRNCAEKFPEARGAGRCRGSWHLPSPSGGSGPPARKLQQVPRRTPEPLAARTKRQAGLTGHSPHTCPGLPAQGAPAGEARGPMPEAPAQLLPAA